MTKEHLHQMHYNTLHHTWVTVGRFLYGGGGGGPAQEALDPMLEGLSVKTEKHENDSENGGFN